MRFIVIIIVILLALWLLRSYRGRS